MDGGAESKDFNKGLPSGPGDAQAIAIDDEAARAHTDADSSSEKGSHDESIPKQKKPLKERRVFEKGFPLIPFAILTSLLLLGIGLAIAIPVMYMAISPALTQTAVSTTYIELYNIKVFNWSYTQTNPANICEPYFPNFMNVQMDVKFSKLPWYVQLGPLYIEPGALGLYYNDTRFGTLYQPRFDLSHPDDDIKWQNGTVMVMQVDNVLQFLKANADLLDLGSITKGWTIWNQNGPIIVTYKNLGIEMHYDATMNQDTNVSRPQFLDGPMATVQDNVFDAMICINNAETGNWEDTFGEDTATTDTATTDAAAPTTEAAPTDAAATTSS